MKTTIASVLFLALAGTILAELPEDPPTLTQQVSLTAWGASTTSTGPTTCTLGESLIPVVGTRNPLCKLSTVATGDKLRYASLVFPPTGGETCVITSLIQPNEIDPADIETGERPLTIRVPYTRFGGGTGTSSGGVCTGECAVLTAQVFSQVDGSIIAVPGYGAVYTSDNLPNGGAAFPGKKITAAIRGIRFPVARRNPLIVKICRNGANPLDTSNATLNLYSNIQIVWPVIGRDAAFVPQSQPESVDAPFIP